MELESNQTTIKHVEFAADRQVAAPSFAADTAPAHTNQPRNALLWVGDGRVKSASIKDRLNDMALSSNLAFPDSVLKQGRALPFLHRGNYAPVNFKETYEEE